MSVHRGELARSTVPRAALQQAAPVGSKPLQDVKVPSARRQRARERLPRGAVLPRVLERLQLPEVRGEVTECRAGWAAAPSARVEKKFFFMWIVLSHVERKAKPRGHRQFRSSRCMRCTACTGVHPGVVVVPFDSCPGGVNPQSKTHQVVLSQGASDSCAHINPCMCPVWAARAQHVAVYSQSCCSGTG